MQVPPNDPFGRRRAFVGVGRYPGTLQHVVAELNPDGTDYAVLPNAPPEPQLGPTLETVKEILSASAEPLTRPEILARWPESEPPPRADSLWRTLTRGCETGMLVRTGAGTRAEAFRYGLAAQTPA